MQLSEQFSRLAGFVAGRADQAVRSLSRAAIGEPDSHLIRIDLQMVSDQPALFERGIRKLTEDSMESVELNGRIPMTMGEDRFRRWGTLAHCWWGRNDEKWIVEEDRGWQRRWWLHGGEKKMKDEGIDDQG